MKTKNIAIFGATGHIGKNMVSFFSKNNDVELYLFSRNTKKIESLRKLFHSTNLKFYNFDEFEKYEYHAIINCIGIGNPSDFQESSVLNIAEFFDNKIINYLMNVKNSHYIHFSSGAVFGKEFNSPISDSSLSKIDINDLDIGAIYSISKLYLETKHRSLHDLNIIDLRLFGFFSKFIDINSGFFLSEIIKSIKNNSEFVTNQEEITRDYVDPADLYHLVNCCITKKQINDVFDVISKKPVSKSEILYEFTKEFGLKFRYDKTKIITSPTGLKKKYFSLSRKAEKIKYFPRYSSLETILNESKFIL